MLKLLARLFREEEAQGLSEYGLIIVMMVILIVGAIAAASPAVKNAFNKIISKLGEGTNSTY